MSISPTPDLGAAGLLGVWGLRVIGFRGLGFRV